jgi:2,3-bisphosphoglycerate-independent phosphoglycerate mutase
MMTHTAAPVPFVIYSGEENADEGVAGYDEDSAKASGLYIEEGFRLMEMIMGRGI